jgi:hypothetical protein
MVATTRPDLGLDLTTMEVPSSEQIVRDVEKVFESEIPMTWSQLDLD